MTNHLIELTPTELAEALKNHSVTLVDVREPAEYAAEHIHGALLFPLSTFDPTALPMDPNKPIVLNCGIGKRSAMAAAKCAQAGVAINRHLAGYPLGRQQACPPPLLTPLPDRHGTVAEPQPRPRSRQ